MVNRGHPNVGVRLARLELSKPKGREHLGETRFVDIAIIEWNVGSVKR